MQSTAWRRQPSSSDHAGTSPREARPRSLGSRRVTARSRPAVLQAPRAGGCSSGWAVCPAGAGSQHEQRWPQGAGAGPLRMAVRRRAAEGLCQRLSAGRCSCVRIRVHAAFVVRSAPRARQPGPSAGCCGCRWRTQRQPQQPLHHMPPLTYASPF